MKRRNILPSVIEQIAQHRTTGNNYVRVETPSGPMVVSLFEYDAGSELPSACYTTETDRSQIYNSIDIEREYQDQKYGPNKQQSIAGFLLIIENELNEAKQGWTKNSSGRHSVMHEIRQIAATCVAAMEKYGTTGTAVTTDDIPCDNHC